MQPRKLAIVALLLLMPGCADAATKTLDTVVATGLKNPQEFDIKGIKKGLSKFSAIAPANRDKIGLAYYIYGDSVPDLSTLTLALVDGERSTELPVLPGGRIELPPSIIDMPDSTAIVSNAPKNSFRIVYKIDVIPGKGGSVDLAYLRSAMVQAQSAWKAAYGLAGFLVPKFNCVEFQFKSSQTIEIDDRRQTQLWSASGDRIKVPLKTRAWPDAATLRFDPAQLIRIATCKE